jgi:hypothetical protein
MLIPEGDYKGARWAAASSQSMRPAGAPRRCESISASSRCADVGALGTEAPASALTAIVSTIDVAASRLHRSRESGDRFAPTAAISLRHPTPPLCAESGSRALAAWPSRGACCFSNGHRIDFDAGRPLLV